jgi:hypothetical protein
VKPDIKIRHGNTFYEFGNRNQQAVQSGKSGKPVHFQCVMTYSCFTVKMVKGKTVYHWVWEPIHAVA